MKEKTIGKKLICEHCGHSWAYTGNLILATCPSCGYKVRVQRPGRFVG